MKICVIMQYTSNIASYSTITEQINNIYCKKWGYDLRVFKDTLIENKALQWSKIKAMYDVLMESKYDYIFWIDSDAFFNDHNIPLELFIRHPQQYELYICDDLPNNSPGQDCRVNTGTILVKNSEYMKVFFKNWLAVDSRFNYDLYHEQTILDLMIKEDYMECRDKIMIYSANAFNSIYNKLKANNFIIHMMAMKADVRVEISSYFLNKLLENN